MSTASGGGNIGCYELGGSNLGNTATILESSWRNEEDKAEDWIYL